MIILLILFEYCTSEMFFFGGFVSNEMLKNAARKMLTSFYSVTDLVSLFEHFSNDFGGKLSDFSKNVCCKIEGWYLDYLCKNWQWCIVILSNAMRHQSSVPLAIRSVIWAFFLQIILLANVVNFEKYPLYTIKGWYLG